MRKLGIDYGDSRIGLAVSDPLGWTAQGLETLKNNGDMEEMAEKIVEIARSYEVDTFVLGMPKNMNGTIGPRGEKSKEFAELLRKSTDNTIPVILWDERLTSVAATKALHQMDQKVGKDKGAVDRISATYILQGYLDSK